jgi:hypothetical protein
LLSFFGLSRRKAWPAINKCLLKLSIIVDLLVVTVFPSLSAVGSWDEVLLFTVSQNVLELELQVANFCLKKLAFAWFLISLKSCVSLGLFDASVVRHRMFLCWLREVRSGVNQGLYQFLVLHFLKGACLF